MIDLIRGRAESEIAGDAMMKEEEKILESKEGGVRRAKGVGVQRGGGEAEGSAEYWRR